MTKQQDYAIDQYDLCCSLLEIDPSHKANCPTLWDAIREIIKERDSLNEALAAANQRADESLAAAIKDGIAATPERILTDEVVAAIRCPVPLGQFTRLLKGWPADTTCDQYGQWFRILKPTPPTDH